MKSNKGDEDAPAPESFQSTPLTSSLLFCSVTEKLKVSISEKEGQAAADETWVQGRGGEKKDSLNESSSAPQYLIQRHHYSLILTASYFFAFFG